MADEGGDAGRLRPKGVEIREEDRGEWMIGGVLLEVTAGGAKDGGQEGGLFPVVGEDQLEQVGEVADFFAVLAPRSVEDGLEVGLGLDGLAGKKVEGLSLIHI